VEEYCRAGQAIDDNMTHALCMLHNQGYKHTLRMCNMYRFSTVTVVARTPLNVTFLHILPVLFIFPNNCNKFSNKQKYLY